MKDPRYGIIALAVLVFALSSCDRTRNDKGYEYFPDMAHSLAYETYSPNPNTASGSSNLTPVKGTIARGETYFHYGPGMDGRVLAGKELLNPFQPSPEVIATGKEQYGIYCLICHGEKGDGNGPIYTAGLYTFQPRSLVNETVRGIPDGEIYHTITVGFGLMGAHGAQVSPDDRWKIIHYIRQELQK